jgi:hypothetical protein
VPLDIIEHARLRTSGTWREVGFPLVRQVFSPGSTNGYVRFQLEKATSTCVLNTWQLSFFMKFSRVTPSQPDALQPWKSSGSEKNCDINLILFNIPRGGSPVKFPDRVQM